MYDIFMRACTSRFNHAAPNTHIVRTSVCFFKKRMRFFFLLSYNHFSVVVESMLTMCTVPSLTSYTSDTADTVIAMVFMASLTLTTLAFSNAISAACNFSTAS